MGRSSKDKKLSKVAPRNMLLGERGIGLQPETTNKNLSLEVILEDLKSIQKETVEDQQLSINMPSGSLKEKEVSKEVLFGVDFTGYDFSFSELRNIDFGDPNKKLASSLNNTNFQEARLRRINFENVSLKKANLKKAELNFSEFRAADLNGADITGGTFFGSEFVDMNSGSLDCVFDGENVFNKTTFKNCLRPFSQETNLEGMRFLGADINQVMFSVNQQLKKTIFFEASINNSALQEADLEGATLSLAKITDTDLKAANLENTDLSHTKVDNVNFYHANLKEASLSYFQANDSVFADADFEGADLNGAVFTNCHFARVDLTKAKNRTKAKFINCTGLN